MLTPAGDIAAFADAIASLLGDAQLRQSMSQAARRFVFEERSLRCRGGAAGVDPRKCQGGPSMADGTVWQPLLAELDRWQRCRPPAPLWLRDDDAIEPTAALDRLLDLTGRHAIPATAGGHPGACRRAARRAACAEHRMTPSPCMAGRTTTMRRPAKRSRNSARIGRPSWCSPNCRKRKPSSTGCLPGKLHPFSCRPGTGSTPTCCRRLARSVLPRCRCSAAPSRRHRLVNTHVDIIDWHGRRGGKDHGVLVAGTCRASCAGAARPTAANRSAC